MIKVKEQISTENEEHFSIYKINEATNVVTINSLNEIANLMQNKVPFAKVALLFRGKAKQADMFLYNALKRNGLKPIIYYFKKNYTADIDILAELFFLPEDVRAVLTNDISLSSAVNYFAGVRKVRAFFLCDGYLGFQQFCNYSFIRNGRQIHKLYFDLEKTITFLNIDGDFMGKTFLSIALNTFYLIDYRLRALIKGKDFCLKKYNAVKCALIDCANNFCQDNAFENFIKVITLTDALKRDYAFSTALFGAISQSLSDNLDVENEFLLCERAFDFYLDVEKSFEGDYSDFISRLAFAFNVDSGFVLRGIKGQIAGLNKITDIIKEQKEEILSVKKIFLLFKKNYKKNFGKIVANNYVGLKLF